MTFSSRFEDHRLVAVIGFVFRAVLARYGMCVLPCAQNSESLRTASLNRYVLNRQYPCLVSKIRHRSAVREVQRSEGDIHLLVILRQRSNIAHNPEVVITFAESDFGILCDGDRLVLYDRFTDETGGGELIIFRVIEFCFGNLCRSAVGIEREGSNGECRFSIGRGDFEGRHLRVLSACRNSTGLFGQKALLNRHRLRCELAHNG